MATYDDLYSSDPLTGKDVGVVFGVIHAGITPTGVPNDVLKDFVVSPTTYGPFYPMGSYPKDFVADGALDVICYDDGAAVTVSGFNPTTGTITLSSAPATGSVMTADVVEQRELYIAQNAKLTPKQEDEKLDQLRNSVQRKTYGNIEFSLKADFKISDLETLKMIFEPVLGSAGHYEFPETPPLIYCAIIIEQDNTITDIIYCEDARATFSDILSAKAGKNAVENGFEITFGVPPIWVNVALSA